MIVLTFAILGILLGILKARKSGGNRLDMAQYAAGFGIALALLGLAVTIIVERLIA